MAGGGESTCSYFLGGNKKISPDLNFNPDKIITSSLHLDLIRSPIAKIQRLLTKNKFSLFSTFVED